MSPTSGLGGVFMVVLDWVPGGSLAGQTLTCFAWVPGRVHHACCRLLPQTYVSAEQSWSTGLGMINSDRVNIPATACIAMTWEVILHHCHVLPGKIPPLIMCVALTSVLFIYICECRDSLKSSETRYNRQSSDKGLWDQKGADTSLLTDTIFRNTGFKAIGRRASVIVNSCHSHKHSWILL